jgi:two-component system chemotaxis sensor kinase CheA
MNFEDNKGLFLDEAADILARMEGALVALEKRPDDGELVHEVFRALHTIKGSGAMFGFLEVSAFAHSLENLFDDVRNGRLAVDSKIIDIGLRAGDCIASMLSDKGGGEASQLLGDIGALLGGAAAPQLGGAVQVAAGPGPGTTSPAAPGPAASGPAGAEGLPSVYRIRFVPRSQILHRGVSLEALFRELRELGPCHTVALTEALPALEDLVPSQSYFGWMITLSTVVGLAAVRSVFEFVEDWSELEIGLVEPRIEQGELVVPKIGQILVDRGLLGPEEAEALGQRQRPFGEIAVQSGKVSKEDLASALAEQACMRSARTERETRQESATIRVRREKLDKLVDLVGELVILQAVLDLEAKKEERGGFSGISENLSRLSSDLRDAIMGMRMVPLQESFAGFQRLVRDLGLGTGKEISLEISGADTELDKNVIESLKDPLVHIIRNSADHGIEAPAERESLGKPRAGLISIAARQTGAKVEITVSDDGAGLNLEKIKARAVARKLLDPQESDKHRITAMIFEPGFSTAEKTTGISGRGVGMDVVRRNVERLRGEVSVRSEAGRGTTISLSIPLTLVIIEGLLVRIAAHEYVIPLSLVEECVDLTASVRGSAGGDSMIMLRDMTVPVLSLRESLGIASAYEGISRLVIVSHEQERIGLMADAVIGRMQVVIKPLSSTLRSIKTVSGATILGDGSVALILDVAEIIKAKVGR